MALLVNGTLKIEGPNLSGFTMDSSGFKALDGSSYDIKTDTLCVTPNSTFTLYRKVRVFIFWDRWEMIACIKNGNGTTYVNFKQIEP